MMTIFSHSRHPARRWVAPAGCTALLALSAQCALAFNSGSTGVDGTLAPTINTEVVLPASGTLNYAAINIPAGVTVTFRPNARNTPVVLLVSGNATIAGTIDVSGKASAASGSAGDGVLADDGIPGAGGPGGFAGGRGGRPGGDINAPDRNGGPGLGPGGGGPGLLCVNEGTNNWYPGAGHGGGFSAAGSAGGYATSVQTTCPGANRPGAAYGSAELQPLIGGSGGGGGRTRGTFYASGGGGGGGALLLAVSGTLSITGNVLASGGAGGPASVPTCSVAEGMSAGAGGSGGAIRLVATTLAGNGAITAAGGTGGSGTCAYSGGTGSTGRIRLEAEVITRTSGTTPAYSFALPGPLFLTAAPALRITTVAGVAVPDPPTGIADVRLPENQPNPVTVAFAASGIPVGTTINVKVSPVSGADIVATSTALAGTDASSTATASINLPLGGSSVQAYVTYTVTAGTANALARLTGSEPVDRVTVTAGLDGRSSVTLITASGREVVVSPEAFRIAAAGS